MTSCRKLLTYIVIVVEARISGDPYRDSIFRTVTSIYHLDVRGQQRGLMPEGRHTDASTPISGENNPFIIGMEKLLAENWSASGHARIGTVDCFWAQINRNQAPSFGNSNLYMRINLSR